MTAKPRHADASVSATLAPVVLFGIDSRGKPKAARFTKGAANLALKAASQLQLRTIAGDDPKIAEMHSWDQIGLGDLVVAQETLEDGWYDAIVVEVNGDMLTLRWRDYPRERRIVRHRFRVALLYPGSQPASQPAKQARASSPKIQSAARKDEASLPVDWHDIDVNKLVLAKDDGPVRSWWEVIPVEKAGDKFKLRWRDYSTVPPIDRERFALALICPEAA